MENPFKLAQMRKTRVVVEILHISQTQSKVIHPRKGTFHNRASIKNKVLGILETNFFFFVLSVTPCSGAGMGTDTYISREK